MTQSKIRYWHRGSQILFALGAVLIGLGGVLVDMERLSPARILLLSAAAMWGLGGIIVLIRTPRVLSAIDHRHEGITTISDPEEDWRTDPENVDLKKQRNIRIAVGMIMIGFFVLGIYLAG